jgi:hypothetical protein
MTDDTDHPQPSVADATPGGTRPPEQAAESMPHPSLPSPSGSSAMRHFGAVVASIALVAAIVYAVAWLSADRLPGEASFLPLPGQGVAPGLGQRTVEPPPFQWPPGSKVVPERATGRTPGFRFAEVPGHWKGVRDAFLRQIRHHRWTVVQRETSDGSRGVTMIVEKAGWARIIGIRERPGGRICTVSIGKIAGPQQGAAAPGDKTEGK